MNKKNLLTIFTLLVLTCSNVNAQGFELFSPADLNELTGQTLGGGDTFDGPVNIGTLLGLSASDVILNISNANIVGPDVLVPGVAEGVWTVGEGSATTFVFSGPVAVEAFINHGANLGSPSFSSGSSTEARDGVTAAPGEAFTLQSALDTATYTLEEAGNDFFVEFTGNDDGNISINQPGGVQTGFFFTSDQAVTQYSVFSTNTSNADLDDNFTTGFRIAATAVPEPSSAAMLVAFTGMFFLRRKRS